MTFMLRESLNPGRRREADARVQGPHTCSVAREMVGLHQGLPHLVTDYTLLCVMGKMRATSQPIVDYM